MSSDNQNKSINPIGNLKFQSKFKRPLEISIVQSQPSFKYAKLSTLSNKSQALLQNEKSMPTQPIVQCPKVYVPPSAVGIDNETEEIDVVAVEPERRPVIPVKFLPIKSQIQYALKAPSLQSQIPGTKANSAYISSLAMANKNKAYTLFNFDELRRRTHSAFRRRGLHGPTDKSLQLLTIAAYDFLKDIIEQVTAVAKSRIEGATNNHQQTLVREERKKIEFLNEVQGFLEAHEPEVEETPNNPDEKGAEKMREHRETQIFNANETAMSAIGGRRCPIITPVYVNNNKSKLLTLVQMQDCLFFMENNAMFCKSELLYENSLKYT